MNKNIYTHSFTARCPNDNESVYYTLTIEVSNMIMAEDIVAVCYGFDGWFHENIAEELALKFDGKQILEATHLHRVSITTIRGDDEDNARH